MYLETVIPILVQDGASPSGVVHTVAAWSVLVGEHAGQHLPADVREAAMSWLSAFLGRWNADIATAALEAGQSARS